MTRFLEGVLSVIAVALLLIAYGLLKPEVAAFEGNEVSRPASMVPRAAEQPQAEALYDPRTFPTPVGSLAAPVRTQYRAIPTNQVMEVSSPTAAPVYNPPPRTRTARTPRRDWKKTALVIGGTSAAGAGIGGIFGGKKGALIGAAIGGGATTVYEASRR